MKDFEHNVKWKGMMGYYRAVNTNELLIMPLLIWISVIILSEKKLDKKSAYCMVLYKILENGNYT